MKKNKIFKLIFGVVAVGMIILNVMQKVNYNGSGVSLKVLSLGLIANAEDSETWPNCSPNVDFYPDQYWNYNIKTGYSWNDAKTIYRYPYLYYNNWYYKWAFSKSDALYRIATEDGVNIDSDHFRIDPYNDSVYRLQTTCGAENQDCCVEYRADWTAINW